MQFNEHELVAEQESPLHDANPLTCTVNVEHALAPCKADAEAALAEDHVVAAEFGKLLLCERGQVAPADVIQQS